MKILFTFLTEENKRFWTNKKFFYLIFINKLSWYHPKKMNKFLSFSCIVVRGWWSKCLMGQRNMICHRNVLPYKMPPVSLRKSPIYYTFLLQKSYNCPFLCRILWHIKFFYPIRHFMGILEMDFERIYRGNFVFE